MTRFVFVVDPLDGLLPGHDTSVALMEAAQRLGAEVWVTGTAGLVIDRAGASAWAQRVRVTPAEQGPSGWEAPASWWRAEERRRIALGGGDAVLMRVDPPVDSAFLRATYVLDVAACAGAFVVNDPRGLRDSNEKLMALVVPGLAPDTVVTACGQDIRDSLERWRVAVAKPLEGAGGRGVVILRRGDPGTSALIDLVTEHGMRHVVVQQYIAGATQGDKRVILLGGEPVGAINRRASEQDFRCNMAAGGTAERASLDAAELAICARIRPELERRGLALVGIDVIGGLLTEVNVTSPTGIREIEWFTGDPLSDRVVEWIADAAPRSGRCP
ncbi:glutathione synthase [Streptomyces olivaceus]|uniref:glutathione synthase n=1 Tax=Streptomyces olivaceus TaxID=47716 RepID=UPI001CCBD5B4|nr:glutathione synthase [Streptomyces olivaceus]MBZ6080493.1 glutathione synthase [Streptomyces olivaceus]